MYYINRVQPQLKFLVGVYIKGCCWSGIHLLARPAVACFPNRTWSLLRPLQSYPVHRRCFIFLFVLLKNIGELASQACTREHYLALAVNKPPAVYILSPSLDGLNLVPRFSLLPWERGYDGLKGLWVCEPPAVNRLIQSPQTLLPNPPFVANSPGFQTMVMLPSK